MVSHNPERLVDHKYKFNIESTWDWLVEKGWATPLIWHPTRKHEFGVACEPCVELIKRIKEELGEDLLREMKVSLNSIVSCESFDDEITYSSIPLDVKESFYDHFRFTHPEHYAMMVLRRD